MTTAETRACDAEPIHIPGSIQPHGVLVALDPRSGLILQISANCADHFGRSAAAVLGRPLNALLGAAAGPLSQALTGASATSGDLAIEIEGRMFDVLAHRHQGVDILELERSGAGDVVRDLGLRAALGRLQRPNGLGELCAVAVDAVRKLTGFDRVMMYRFGDDGHGDVIEESLDAGVTSYRGLRFPASDIPRQARAMYLLNWLRLIPDAAYTPVPLVPELRPDTGSALDLSFATLRSVSPVHLEYLRNMGVRASMSVSLVESNELWGLIACHHHAVHHVSFATRAACEVIGRVVALQIAALEDLSVRSARRALLGTESRLVDAMREGRADVAMALTQRGEALLRLVGATGAAVCTEREVRTVGATPTPAQLALLVAWLRRRSVGGILHSHALAELHPPAAEYAQVASGLLVMTLPHSTPSYVVWFRPEVVRTVTWAGDPTRSGELTDAAPSLHPRHSFAAWTQIVRGTALPWQTAEIDAAEELRRRAVEVDLGNQIERAEQAVRLRDDMVAVVSHDLNSPLQVIQLSLEMLPPHIADVRIAKGVERIGLASERMTALIHDVLDLAKMESGRFDVTLVPCAIQQLMGDVFAMIAPIAEAKDVRLTWAGDGALRVEADRERIFRVLSNLAGNAIKFTPAGGAVTIDVTPAGGTARFAVRDTGPGIAAVELPHVFDRYWQTRGSRVGSGLGLYIAKGIVEAHGQRLWVESTYGSGATFHFTLPLRGPDVPGAAVTAVQTARTRGEAEAERVGKPDEVEGASKYRPGPRTIGNKEPLPIFPWAPSYVPVVG